MNNKIADIVAGGAREYGIDIPASAGFHFQTYFKHLEAIGSVMNLTSIEGAEHVARLHFLDSLAPLLAAGVRGRRFIDVGSGAGFPGLPMKIVEPDSDLVMLDSSRKRIEFLEELCDAMLLFRVKCVAARAEEAAKAAEYRETFDLAVSRAVARLNVLAELSLPFVKPGGIFIAMKSADSDDEVREAERAVSVLGAEIEKSLNYCIPGTDVMHRLVVIRKMAITPAQYPRRFARIKSAPLR